MALLCPPTQYLQEGQPGDAAGHACAGDSGPIQAQLLEVPQALQVLQPAVGHQSVAEREPPQPGAGTGASAGAGGSLPHGDLVLSPSPQRHCPGAERGSSGCARRSSGARPRGPSRGFLEAHLEPRHHQPLLCWAPLPTCSRARHASENLPQASQGGLIPSPSTQAQQTPAHAWRQPGTRGEGCPQGLEASLFSQAPVQLGQMAQPLVSDVGEIGQVQLQQPLQAAQEVQAGVGDCVPAWQAQLGQWQA